MLARRSPWPSRSGSAVEMSFSYPSCMSRFRLPALLPCTVLALSVSCASVKGTYVWVDSYRDSNQVTEPTLAVGDLISVKVREDDKMSTKARIREDGKISVPFVDDLTAVSQTPTQFARQVEDSFRSAKLLTSPHVTVLIEETRAPTFAVLGAVARPGTFPLTPGVGLAEALATAGSLTEFAHKDRIFVLRRLPTAVRIRFTYGGVTGEQGAASAFRLRAGDVVVVE